MTKRGDARRQAGFIRAKQATELARVDAENKNTGTRADQEKRKRALRPHSKDEGKTR